MQRPAHDIVIADRAPDFAPPGPDGKFYQFYERTRGRPAVLLFYPLAESEPNSPINEFSKRHVEFAELGVDLFAISLDRPENNRKLNLPFLIWTDPNRAITNGYLDGAGILPDQRRGPVAFLLDANQRVLAIQAGMDSNIADSAYNFFRALPPPPVPQVLHVGAPAIMMPNLIDKQMCLDLIQMWHQGGHEEGGVTSVVDDDEVHRIHATVKKRRDHRIMGPTFHDILQWTIGRRIAPEIEKAFRYSGFRFDRFLVTCYDAERGDYFRRHRDNLSPENADRVFALTLNLNAEEYSGGELLFPEYGPHKYKPESGGGVIFSCSLVHEALPVTSGRRFTLLTFLRSPSNG